ncbi:unnamed protein product [Prorocentrum cordatum]|uniref:PDZ domain-containing protein n=1 Tax=Prorocentrum cordatum TaxID=2364126 RepID=A0ABN9W7M6_9DINO|nr:unnamed protein product [Polarella glacialis]
MPRPCSALAACGGLLWRAALLALPARGALTASLQEQLNATFGAALLERFVACEAAATSCAASTRSWMSTVGARGYGLKSSFDACPVGCEFAKSGCDNFRSAAVDDAAALQSECEDNGLWPVACILLERDLTEMVNSDLFEVGVMCSIISAETREALPECSVLAQMTVANSLSINGSSCENWDHDTCVDHFCGLYDKFWWRMNASNLQGHQAHALPVGEGILSGCELLSASGAFVNNNTALNMEQCSARRDVAGICDCLCGAFTQLEEGIPGTDCAFHLDAFMLFGRLGAVGVEVPEECETDICDMFDQVHDRSQCQSLDLPDVDQCIALSLAEQHYRPIYCPWLDSDSGEDGVLECLDGTRCDVQDWGWSCCEDHLGRAKCPRNLPVMCEELCGGETEHCCGTSCEQRGCSLMLRTDAYQDLFTTTTVTTVTTSAPPGVEDPGLFGFVDDIELEWHDSMLLWLLVIVPCNCVCLWCCRNSMKREVERQKASTQQHPAGLKSEIDKDGSFNLVQPFPFGRNVEDGKGKEMKVHETILVHELPLSRPLGLELEECLVVRVHAQGAKWGWQVGDIIFEVAGKPVSTFEEVYRILTDEKKRPPVKFSVWREASTAMAVMAASEAARPTSVAGAGPPGRGSSVAPETGIQGQR